MEILEECKPLADALRNINVKPDSFTALYDEAVHYKAKMEHWINRFHEAQDELDAMERYHPRAMKLLRKQKTFVVVAIDEPYFIQVYSIIKYHERTKGTWTKEDENKYRAIINQLTKTAAVEPTEEPIMEIAIRQEPINELAEQMAKSMDGMLEDIGKLKMAFREFGIEI